RSLTSYSGILFVSRIVGLIFNQMDKFLIWLFLAVARLAVYDVVVRPANLVRMLISIINSAVVPEAARLHQRHDIAGIKVLYIDLVRYAYLIVLPVVVVAWVHIDVLLTLWVGADFAEYGNLVRIMLAVYLIAPLPSMASTIVVGMELVRKTIWISVVASVINVALSLALLKSMGLAGLLTATLVAEVFMLFPYLSMMKHILGLGAAELIQPMTRIMALSAPFVASQLVLGVLPIRSPWLLLSCVAGLASLHAAVHVRYLLTDRERRYLLEKCGMRKRSFVWGNLSR
ncbi:MAG: oligosaccharide flippase family protein, partial [Candidatus Zixiibacteriota bacterium]